MEHLTLYRQFRPKSFDEVIGQDHIVKTLQNQIKNSTVGHAYLFCGTRGTGKTSCAKIFAKAVNCLHPKNGSPCEECEVCKSIGVNGNLDILEIDAASNNRVDEIRDLREKIKYFPTVGKYKVYIIDEVHMLTDSAANALLKTLEEPPAHAIFILATTDPAKLPATILSRCMRFDFKLVSSEDLVKHLENILTKTSVKYEKEALELIANAGYGSVRDTLSVAEMCVAYCNNDVTYEKVSECLGLTDSKTLEHLAEAIIVKDGGRILDTISALYTAGKNLSNLLKDLCGYFNSLLTITLSKNAKTILNLPADVFTRAEKLTKKSDPAYLLYCLRLLSEGEGQLKNSTNEKINAETTLLGCILNHDGEVNELARRLSVMEQKQTGVELETKSFKPQAEAPQEIAKEEPKSASVATEPEPIVEIVADGIPLPTDGDIPLDEEMDSKKPVQKFEVKGERNAKQILGDLVTYLRINQHMLLHEACREVEQTDIVGEEYVLVLKNRAALNLFEENKTVLADFLKKYFALRPKLELRQDATQDKIEVLKQKLGKKLVIE